VAEESVGFVQAVTEDLRRVHAEQERQASRLDSLRDLIQGMQLGKMHSLELEQANQKATVDRALAAITELRASQQWISRLLIGALLTGMVSGAVALVYKMAAGQ